MTNSFSSRIKELRLSLKATQTAFADKIGTTQTALSSYEQGDRMPSVEILVAISKELGVSIDWLLGLSDIKNIDNKPETMGDILKALFIISEYCKLKIYPHNETFEEDIFLEYPTSTQRILYEIGFENITLNNFIYEWDKMYNLYESGTIDEEVYSLWTEKTINKASSYDIDNNNISNEDIPF